MLFPIKHHTKPHVFKMTKDPITGDVRTRYKIWSDYSTWLPTGAPSDAEHLNSRSIPEFDEMRHERFRDRSATQLTQQDLQWAQRCNELEQEIRQRVVLPALNSLGLTDEAKREGTIILAMSTIRLHI